MSAHVPMEDLEDLALRRGDGAREIEAHVAGCASCARELAWLRAEQALLQRRGFPRVDVDRLWAGVQRRLDPGVAEGPARSFRPRRARRFAAAAAAALSAAAAVAIVATKLPPGWWRPAGTTQRLDHEIEPVDPRVLAALDRAEGEMRHAIDVLEAEYRENRGRLDPAVAERWDASLARARENLGTARQLAASDVRARLRLLDGYTGYVRTLRRMVQDSEEGSP